MVTNRKASEDSSRTLNQSLDAEYEKRLTNAIDRGIRDIEQGHFTTSIDDAFKRAAALRNQR